MMNNAVRAKPVTENPEPASAVVTDGVAVVACVVTFDTSGVSENVHKEYFTLYTKYDLHNIIYSWYIIKHALPVTSISPVVSSTTKSTGVVTSTTTLETSVSVVRELVIMLSSAVASGNDSTTAVVSNGDIDELVVVVVDVLVVVIL